MSGKREELRRWLNLGQAGIGLVCLGAGLVMVFGWGWTLTVLGGVLLGTALLDLRR